MSESTIVTLDQMALCREALSWVGTKYRHQAALKGVGCDCAGLIIGVGKACGLIAVEWQPPLYSPQHHLHRQEQVLLGVLEALGLEPLPVDAHAPGDVLVFQWARRRGKRTLPASHTALAMPHGKMIHAIVDDQVRYHSLAGDWLRDLRGAYRFPGVSV